METTIVSVCICSGGKRLRLSLGDLNAAKTEAAAKAAQLARGDVDAVQLTGRDRLTYGLALEAVKPFGAPLDVAAIEYAEAKKLLGGHSLIEAARIYMRHHGRGIAAKPVPEATIDFRQSKADAGRSELYLKDIAYRLRLFAKAFHCDVAIRFVIVYTRFSWSLFYDLSEDAATETAMVFGELYRSGAEWKFRAVGQGYAAGLVGIAQDFGVSV